jgi:hypothetical protein
MATNVTEPWAECVVCEFKRLSDEELYKLRYGDIEEQIREDTQRVGDILTDMSIKVHTNGKVTLALHELLTVCYKFRNNSDDI